MKTKNYQGGAAYSAPALTLVEVSSEGILCESYENESYDDIYNYGEGKTNKGWY